MIFKAGDRVRCINDHAAPGDLKRGNIYVISEVYDAIDEWGIRLKEFPTLGFFGSRFELVKEGFILDAIED